VYFIKTSGKMLYDFVEGFLLAPSTTRSMTLLMRAKDVE
jgi:hypothetical protein